MKRRAILLSLAASLLLTGVVLALAPPPAPQLNWWVIGGGGGHAAAGAYGLDGTIGQAVTAVVRNTSYELCAGFWCGVRAAVEYNIYLPLVLKQHG